MNVKPDFSRYASQATTAHAYFSLYDIHAYYGESYIVQGVSFNVHESEILALLGRNGAGRHRHCGPLRGSMIQGSPMARYGWTTGTCTR